MELSPLEQSVVDKLMIVTDEHILAGNGRLVRNTRQSVRFGMGEARILASLVNRLIEETE